MAAAVWLFVLVVSVPEDRAPSADAVIVHGGGSGERINQALGLIGNEAAPVLVVMYGEDIDWVRGSEPLCGQTEPFEVLCPSPEPVTTVGEAQAIGELVAVHDWDSVIIVTTDYHVRRAKTLDQKCTDAEVYAVGGSNRIGTLKLAERILHEMAGMVQALTYSCP